MKRFLKQSSGALIDCTVIILSYNAKNITDTCLTKVEESIEYCEKRIHNRVHVIVVDNASKDGSVEMIRTKHPQVKLIALPTNIGYAAGNNTAMNLVRTPFNILMNSDTYINRDSIVHSLIHLEKNPHCDVLVSRCVYLNGVFQNYGGFLPTPFRIILWSLGFESIPILKNYLHRIYSFNPEFYTKEGIMEWCPPNFLLMKRHVYEKTHGFDEQLFFHMVDVEWCHRMKNNNLIICYTPTIEVIHIGGASSKDIQNNLTRDNFKGLMHFTKKHYPEKVRLISMLLRLGLYMRSALYWCIGNRTLSQTYNQIATDVQSTA